MKKYLNKRYLEKVFQANYTNLKTGTDKVTREKFESNSEREFKIIKRKCLDATYSFTRLKKYDVNGRTFNVPTIRDQILLKLLRKVLERKFKINYPDRDSIIELVIKKLRYRHDSYVLRLDIKDFFPSIPHNFLLEQIKKNYRISTIEYHLIKEFLKLREVKGLPTGISLSSTLSEVYLADLDFKLKKIHPKISHYFRYVDDILIIVNGNLDNEEAQIFKDEVKRCINKKGLKINESKHDDCNLHFKKNKLTKFDYLGYDFRVNNRKPFISIADEKIQKIKGRIKFTFHDYKRNNNLELFFNRLKYLTQRNTMVKKSLNLTRYLDLKTDYNLVYHGVTETYKYVDRTEWENLDSYLQGNFYTFFRKKIESNEKFKNKLFKFSFQKSIDAQLVNCLHLKDNSFFIQELLKIDKSLSKDDLQKINRHELETKYRNKLSV